MDLLFEIGDFVFRLICPQEIAPPENFMRFACEGKTAAYTYAIETADTFPRPHGERIAAHPDLTVYRRGGLEMRYIGVKGASGSYAYYEELDDSHARVLLSPYMFDACRTVDPVWLAMLAMERRMIERDALTLHCAYMRYGDEAILFSAPSGTGKTTQATLWEQYRGSRVINGDKSLLQRIGCRWTARGWPVCGSSGVCHNEDTPIRAIVMLSQGKTDTIRRLSQFQAFTQIYSQITINSWNREAQQRSMDLIEALVAQVPVYHLSCTISEDAVKCLESALGE